MEFIKYQAAGNDFIAFRDADLEDKDYPSLARKICHRQLGLGADGIIIARPSQKANIEMLYFNRDGSQGEMCGNGIRSFAKYICENNILDENILEDRLITIDTLDGIKDVEVQVSKGQVDQVKVYMGRPSFKPEQIPAKLDMEEVINHSIYIDQVEYRFSALRLGVPHLVIFVKDIEEMDLDYIGSRLEQDPLFPQGINVNFVELVNSGEIKIYSWERGVGRTLGCGTGACSAVVVGHKLFLLASKVLVRTQGGSLWVELSGDQVIMKGSAQLVAQGKFNYREGLSYEG